MNNEIYLLIFPAMAFIAMIFGIINKYKNQKKEKRK
jgi:hypothetical protein